MVRVYKATTGSPRLNYQHHEILKWLDKHKEYHDAHVMLEFKLPKPWNRNFDLVIFHDRGIWVLELKRHSFTKIKLNDQWSYYDKRTRQEIKFSKYYQGRPEHPYSQATSSADALRNWIQRELKYSVSPEFSKYLRSNQFKVFPTVYINRTGFLNGKSIEEDSWCGLVIGTGDLEKCLEREWREFDGYAPYLETNLIDDIVNELSLESQQKSKSLGPGRVNMTLIGIIEYMVEYSTEWTRPEEVNTEVFTSGEKKIEEVRKAIKRGIKEGFIENIEGSYLLQPAVRDLFNQGWEIDRIYSEWANLKYIRMFRTSQPVLFKTVVDETYPAKIKSPFAEQTHQAIEILMKIPESLLIYNLADILQYDKEITPVFFRPGGPIRSDYQNDLISPFKDSQGKNALLEILEELNEVNRIFVLGGPFSGKTTLARWVGLSMISNNVPVVYLNPKDLDKEAVTALVKQGKDAEAIDSKILLVILENIHLATTKEAYWLKMLFQPGRNLKILATSRRRELSVSGENILQDFTDDNGVIINLDDDYDAQYRIKEMTSLVISQLEIKTSSEILNQITETIVSRNDHNPTLIQLELEAAVSKTHPKTVDFSGIPIDVLQSLDSEKFLKLLKDESIDQLEDIIQEKLLDQMDNIVKMIQEDVNYHPAVIRKTVLISFELCYQELPIRSGIIASSWGLDEDQVHQVLISLEQQGVIATDLSETPRPHPSYAKAVLDAVKSSEGKWYELLEEFIELEDNEEDITFSEEVCNRLYRIDPSLKADWVPEQESTEGVIRISETVTLGRLVKLAPELTAGEFVNLLGKVRGSMYGINDSDLWYLWEEIGITELTKMIRSSETIHGPIHLLDWIHRSDWDKFDLLLANIEPGLFLNLMVDSDYDYLDTLFRSIQGWDWNQSLTIEIEATLHYYLSKPGYSRAVHVISEEAFLIIDDLSPDAILREFIQKPRCRMRFFLEFLRDRSKPLNRESRLRQALILIILKDQARELPPRYLRETIDNLNLNSASDKQVFKSGTENWDMQELHDVLLEEDRSSLCSFIDIITHKRDRLFDKLIASFTAGEIKQIILREEIEHEFYYDHWTQILFLLETVEWPHFGKLLDKLDIQLFIDSIKDDVGNFSDYSLVRLLLESDWQEKVSFIENFDFYDWTLSQSDYIQGEILIRYDSVKVPRRKDIGKELLDRSMKKDWPNRSVERIIEVLEKLQWPWKEWVDVDHLRMLLKKDDYRGIGIIKALEKHGWTLSVSIKKQIEFNQQKREKDTWERLTLLQKAEQSYNKEETREEGLALYKEAAREVNETIDAYEIRRFLTKIEKLPAKERSEILGEFDPRRPGMIYDHDRNWEFFDLLEKLKQLEYEEYPEAVAFLYSEFLPGYTNEFWKKHPPGEMKEKTRERIIDILWQEKDHEMLWKLPDDFNSSLKKQMDKFFEQLVKGDTVNPLLLKLILRLTRKEPAEKKILMIQRLVDISLLIQSVKLPNKLIGRFNKEERAILIHRMLEIDSKALKEIMLGSQPMDLVMFLREIDENEKFISVAERSEWEDKLKNEEIEGVILLYYWLKRVYPDMQISKADTGEKESFLVKLLRKTDH